MATRHRPAEDRKEDIVRCAMEVAARVGYHLMTREQIAEKAGVSAALVSARLGTMNELRRAIVRRALADRNIAIVAQALAQKDRHAVKSADDALRRDAAAHLQQQVNSIVAPAA